MKIDNFLSELKRRNVYKVAVAYAVVAWLLVQAASILFPTFEAPPWVMKVFVALIVLGFPIALVSTTTRSRSLYRKSSTLPIGYPLDLKFEHVLFVPSLAAKESAREG